MALSPYPLMLLDYLRYALCPSGQLLDALPPHCSPLDDRFLPFMPTNGTNVLLLFVLAMTWMNYRGLKLVGTASAIFVIFVMLPFVVLCAGSLPHLQPSEWLRTKPFGSNHVAPHLSTAIQTFIWCLNYWDSTSTLAGEVEKPQRVIPSALFSCCAMVILSYLIPILACTAALPGQTWATGFWVQAGSELGGATLQYWIFAAALVSFAGQFAAGQATVAYELLGMAELGQVPTCFMERNSDGVPIYSLGLSVIVLLGVVEVTGGKLG